MRNSPARSRALLAAAVTFASLASCHDAAGPDVTREGDPCPAHVSSLSGFFGCVDVVGRVVDASGKAVVPPDVQLLRPDHTQFEERVSMVLDEDGNFRARFVVGPLPSEGSERERLTLPVRLYYTRAQPPISSYAEPYDSLALDATFVSPFATPYRYHVTLRRGR